MSAEPFPSVTVVMPVRDEASHIRTSLGSVLAQDYPAGRMDVIVVDGASTDGTGEIATEMARHSLASVQVILNRRAIVPCGLNLALARARGDVIVRVDGHCRIPPDYVTTCVRTLAATGADNVGGRQRIVGTGGAGRARAFVATSPFGVGASRFRYARKAGWVSTVYLGAYPRGVFERIGGFDEDLVRDQDDEFNLRLVRSGGRVWFDPAIEVDYVGRSSFRGFAQQYFQYGLYKLLVMRKRGITSWHHLVPSVFLLVLCLSFAVAIARAEPLFAFAVAGPYVLSSVVASLPLLIRDPRAGLIAPVAFSILHGAYGAGFVWACWRWRGHRPGPPSYPLQDHGVELGP